MGLKFFIPKKAATIKCTVHKNGKLGFSKAAMEELNIGVGKYIKIGTMEDDKMDDRLYMVIVENDDGEGFKINKAGKYYYLNTKQLFDDLEADYKTTKIIYDIQKIEYEGESIYRLNRRELDRKINK